VDHTHYTGKNWPNEGFGRDGIDKEVAGAQRAAEACREARPAVAAAFDALAACIEPTRGDPAECLYVYEAWGRALDANPAGFDGGSLPLK
jgi:hypothetical protein